MLAEEEGRMIHPEEAAWYVLHTRSKFEKTVYEGLCRKGREVFLPTVTVRSRRRDRKVYLQQPLFPGYLFVRTENTPERRLDILKTTGVVKLVGNRDQPLPVDGVIVDSIKIIVDAEQQVQTMEGLRPGQSVHVVCGPFAGVYGVFERYQGVDRVVVNIDAMGRAAAVNVAADEVEPLEGKKPLFLR
ncbi:MAG: transcription termination/antitermination protein NusG [Desulfosudaceae bacterium]